MDHGVKRMRGIPYGIEDARIWAEIKYLDSQSDYREYISGEQYQPLGDMVLLDRSTRSLVSGRTILPQVLIGVIVLATAWIMYLFVQGL
jgi:hypothetical protein